MPAIPRAGPLSAVRPLAGRPRAALGRAACAAGFCSALLGERLTATGQARSAPPTAAVSQAGARTERSAAACAPCHAEGVSRTRARAVAATGAAAATRTGARRRPRRDAPRRRTTEAGYDVVRPPDPQGHARHGRRSSLPGGAIGGEQAHGAGHREHTGEGQRDAASRRMWGPVIASSVSTIRDRSRPYLQAVTPLGPAWFRTGLTHGRPEMFGGHSYGSFGGGISARARRPWHGRTCR